MTYQEFLRAKLQLSQDSGFAMEMVHWGRGKCFKSMAELEAAFQREREL